MKPSNPAINSSSATPSPPSPCPPPAPALPAPPPDPPPRALLRAHTLTLRTTLHRLWRLRWDNTHKEAFWRLAANGFSAFPMHASNLQRGLPAARCPCGTAMDFGDRRHHFWDCVIARTLLDDLQRHAAAPLSRAHVWLAQPPAPLSPVVWDVVVLACLSALEGGRRALYAARASRDSVLPRATLTRIGVTVTLDFWARLHDFATLGLAPPDWSTVPPSHPFLCRAGDDSIVAVLPDAASMPA